MDDGLGVDVRGGGGWGREQGKRERGCVPVVWDPY